jgi:peptidoglycan hydrolase CwlO-like protein
LAKLQTTYSDIVKADEELQKTNSELNWIEKQIRELDKTYFAAEDAKHMKQIKENYYRLFGERPGM